MANKHTEWIGNINCSTHRLMSISTSYTGTSNQLIKSFKSTISSSTAINPKILHSILLRGRHLQCFHISKVDTFSNLPSPAAVPCSVFLTGNRDLHIPKSCCTSASEKPRLIRFCNNFS